MALTNHKAPVKETEVFVKKETAFGTLAFRRHRCLRVTAVPTALSRNPSPTARSWSTAAQAGSRRDQTPAANIDLKLYPAFRGGGHRTSGRRANGVRPGQEDRSMRGIGGVRAAIALPSFSLCWKEGHTWFFAAGCKVGSLAFDFAAKAYVNLGFGGMARRCCSRAPAKRWPPHHELIKLPPAAPYCSWRA